MKKFMFSLGFIALTLGATAQVKIKDGSVTGSSTTPNSNAILELESNNKGLLFPRVQLTATNAALTGTTMVAGMVVYNTATAGSGATAVTPGFYYNNGSSWVQIGQGSPNGSNWRVFGSTATPSTNGNPASNTDSQYVMGRVAIGTTTAARVAADTSGSTATGRFAMLTVSGDASITGITVGRGGGQVNGNVAVGFDALQANLNGVNNIAVGSNTLQNNTGGNSNVAVGFTALRFNTSGSSNTGMGFQALNSNTTASNNTAVGYQALASTTANYNTGSGNQALYANTTGIGNTAMGFQAYLSDSTGNYNVALGYQAGYTQSSGNRNIAIGFNTVFPNLSGNYQLNIGNAIYGTGVDSSVTNAANIGINTSAPTSSFQVNGSVSTNISVQSGSYTLKATDYTVVFTGGAAVTATLPSAAGISGRMYRIVASGDGTTVTVFSASGTVMLLSTITTLTGQSAIFQSNGTTWYQVQ